jgi:putative transposase
MADLTSMTTVAAAGKLLASEHSDVLREAVRLMLIEIMEGEVEQHTGAGPYERSPERTTQRNGYRQRQWDTRVGTLELAIPRLRAGQLLPELSGATP